MDAAEYLDRDVTDAERRDPILTFATNCRIRISRLCANGIENSYNTLIILINRIGDAVAIAEYLPIALMDAPDEIISFLRSSAKCHKISRERHDYRTSEFHRGAKSAERTRRWGRTDGRVSPRVWRPAPTTIRITRRNGNDILAKVSSLIVRSINLGDK